MSRPLPPTSPRSGRCPRGGGAARSAAAGFSLIEAIVVSAVFLFVVMVVFAALTQSRQTYQLGEQNADLQQRARVGFELLLSELRLAGFDHDRDGEDNEYPNQPDEQLEFIAANAISFRANFDVEEGQEAVYAGDIWMPAPFEFEYRMEATGTLVSSPLPGEGGGGTRQGRKLKLRVTDGKIFPRRKDIL